MTGYEFHPEARTDLDEIWNLIAEDNPTAASPRQGCNAVQDCLA